MKTNVADPNPRSPRYGRVLLGLGLCDAGGEVIASRYFGKVCVFKSQSVVLLEPTSDAAPDYDEIT